MAIDVTCTCPVQFDKATGRYIPCGHRFRVDDKLAGRRVACPKCRGEVNVPQAAPARKPAAAPRPSSPVVEEDPLGLTPQSPKAHVAAAPPVDLPRRSRQEDDEDDAVLVAPVKGPVVACPNCGSGFSVDAQMCPHCAYHRKLHPRFKELEQLSDEDDMPGWDRWFSEQLSMGESADTVSLWIKIVSVFGFLVALAVVSIWFGGWAALIVAILGFALLGVAVRAGWRGDLPSAALAWGRTFGWRTCSWSPRRLTVENLQGTKANDVTIANLESAKDVEVLDLESLPITDMALPHIARMRNLQFLILRGTKTTENAVRLLQRALPHTWIWR